MLQPNFRFDFNGMKLKSFEIQNPWFKATADQNMKLAELFKSQKNSLQNLSIELRVEHGVLEKIYELPNLTNVKLHNISPNQMITESKLRFNKSIRSLYVKYSCGLISFEFVKALLRKSSNVTRLDLSKMDPKMMEFLSVTYPNLKLT